MTGFTRSTIAGSLIQPGWSMAVDDLFPVDSESTGT